LTPTVRDGELSNREVWSGVERGGLIRTVGVDIVSRVENLGHFGGRTGLTRTARELADLWRSEVERLERPDL
jgi:hypothetical protein